jgi:hypothetical protein
VADSICQHFGISHSANVLTKTLMYNVVGSDLLSIRNTQCTCKRNGDARSCNHRCSGKVISITHSACAFVTLVIRHANFMRHIILSSVAGPAVQYFSTLSNTRHDFQWGGGGSLLNTKCVFRFCLQLLPQTFFNLRRIQRGTLKNVHGFSCTVPVFLTRF